MSTTANQIERPPAQRSARSASSGKAICILNGKAGSDRAARARDEVSAAFESRGYPAEVLVAGHGEDIAMYARLAAQQKAEVVIGAGGDGTLNTIAQSVLGTSTSLGILPLGTLNHFAKELRIPLQLEDAIETVISGKITRVDVGEVNGKIFLNNSSIGVYPWIVQSREKEQNKGYTKWSAFALAFFAILQKYPTIRVALQTGERREPYKDTPFIFIGNNEYDISGLNLGKRETLDAGKLWVCPAPRVGRTGLAFAALRRLCGIREKNCFSCFDTQELLIKHGETEIKVATDGEVNCLKTPLHYCIRPRALRVIVPRQTDAAA